MNDGYAVTAQPRNIWKHKLMIWKNPAARKSLMYFMGRITFTFLN